MDEAVIDRVTKAIRHKALERGYSIDPLARHLAVAAIEAVQPLAVIVHKGRATPARYED